MHKEFNQKPDQSVPETHFQAPETPLGEMAIMLYYLAFFSPSLISGNPCQAVVFVGPFLPAKKVAISSAIKCV